MTTKDNEPLGYKLFREKAAELAKDSAAANRLLDDAFKKAGQQGNKLHQIKSDFTALLSMLKAYFSGDYKKIPWKSLVTALGAVIYFVNPMDLIPDFLLGVGFLDDAAVIAFCIKSIRGDIDDFLRSDQSKKTV